MKANPLSLSAPAFASANLTVVGRFQVHCESRSGDYILGFSTDSDADAIEAFVLQAPAHEGGDVSILDSTEQRMIAFVKWRIARTEIGLPVLYRTNVFHDWHFAMIACELLKQKKNRDAVEMCF